MRNLIEELPDQVNITVTKADLIEFAGYLLKEYSKDFDEQKSINSILNINEVAEFIGISKRTIYKYTQSGIIPFYKQAGKLFFKKDEIEQWLTKNKGYNLEHIKIAASNYILKKSLQ
ncbi:MAG: helix-turn-helix domain-containing protein [Salinivirgaceae bacterium]